MTSANWHALRLSSKGCSTCNDLRRLHARSKAALRNARDLHRAAVKAIDSLALQNLGEELRQTLTAHKLVCYAVDAHLANQHSQKHRGRLAA